MDNQRGAVTAEFMLLGPEQVDRYLDNARRAMAAAIVDPGKPRHRPPVRPARFQRRHPK